MRLSRLRSRYGAALAFLLLAVGGMVAVDRQASADAHKLYLSQLDGCNRGNILRAESNDRLGAHTIDRNVLEEFLKSAETARRAAGSPIDKKAAEEYAQLRVTLKKRVTFRKVPLVDCEKVIRKP